MDTKTDTKMRTIERKIRAPAPAPVPAPYAIFGFAPPFRHQSFMMYAKSPIAEGGVESPIDDYHNEHMLDFKLSRETRRDIYSAIHTYANTNHISGMRNLVTLTNTRTFGLEISDAGTNIDAGLGLRSFKVTMTMTMQRTNMIIANRISGHFAINETYYTCHSNYADVSSKRFDSINELISQLKKAILARHLVAQYRVSNFKNDTEGNLCILLDILLESIMLPEFFVCD